MAKHIRSYSDCKLCLAPNGIIGDKVIPLYVQDAPLCLHVKSLPSGRVGFGLRVHVSHSCSKMD